MTVANDMKKEIQDYIISNEIFEGLYNRNYSRKRIWDNINIEWSNYIFKKYNEYNNKFELSFINFMKLYFLNDSSIQFYHDCDDFIKRNKNTQINPNTKLYNLFFNECKELVNFEPVSFSELLYCIHNNIKDRPHCKCCSNDVDFTLYKVGYRDFCSTICQMKYNNESKIPKSQGLTNSSIRQIYSDIPLDRRNLTNQLIADHFQDVEKYCSFDKSLKTREMIYVFMNKLSLFDLTCVCGNRKLFRSQGQGYSKTCGSKSCIDIAKHGNQTNSKYFTRSKISRGGHSYESGFVYLMYSVDNDFYKIGITHNPINRLEQLKRNIPDIEYKQCVFVDSPSTVEKILHEKFDNQRLELNERFGGYTEFFNLNSTDVVCVKEIINEN